MVQTNVHAAAEDAFNEWYSGVHLPEIVEVPGIHWGRRYELVRDDTSYPSTSEMASYLAIYEIDHPDILRSAPFLDRRGWSPELRSQVKDTVVGVYRLLASDGAMNSRHGEGSTSA